MIVTAATRISPPSTPLEKYSALSWPKLCIRSAGFATMVSAPKATSAATRLTDDSAASDRRLTEPVRKYAPNLSNIVTTDAAMDRMITLRGVEKLDFDVGEAVSSLAVYNGTS